MLLAEAVHANRMAVQHASVPDLRRMLPVLKEAEGQLSTELGRWLKRVALTDKYTHHSHRALLAQIHESILTIQRKLGPAFAADVEARSSHVRVDAMGRLQAMVEAGSEQFEGAIRPLRIDVAAILSDERHLLVAQMRAKAGRYAQDVVGDIGSKLALGFVRGETVDQLASRLLSSTHLIRAFKARGPGGIAEGAAGAMFGKYKWWAQQIARTELVNSYAESQARAIREADGADPGWLMRWDAANDARVCKWCYSLDRTTIEPDGMFQLAGRFGARPHPPLHSCCRCSLVPWRREWSSSRRGKSQYDLEQAA
jgi:hypothetical protein